MKKLNSCYQFDNSYNLTQALLYGYVFNYIVLVKKYKYIYNYDYNL